MITKNRLGNEYLLTIRDKTERRVKRINPVITCIIIPLLIVKLPRPVFTYNQGLRIVDYAKRAIHIQVYSLFQGQFYVQCDAVLRLLRSASSRFLQVIQQLLTSSSSSSYHFCVSFSNVFCSSYTRCNQST